MISLTAKQIKKYDKYSVAQLIEKCKNKFNAFIRKRDEGKPCINCGHYRTLQAGHLYPTSTYSGIRFDEDNVHGECKQCNFYNSQSHSYGYRVNLEKKIGKERMEQLEQRAAIYKRNRSFKWDRITLIWKLENDFKQIK